MRTSDMAVLSAFQITSGEERALDRWDRRYPVGSVDANLACKLSQHKDATMILQSLWRSSGELTIVGLNVVVDSER